MGLEGRAQEIVLRVVAREEVVVEKEEAEVDSNDSGQGRHVSWGVGVGGGAARQSRAAGNAGSAGAMPLGLVQTLPILSNQNTLWAMRTKACRRYVHSTSKASKLTTFVLVTHGD